MFINIGLAPSPRLCAPFPAWKEKDIHLVEHAIVVAWEYLRPDAAATHVLNRQKEVEISIKLIDILETMLNDESVSGFTGRRFSPPVRGQELIDVTAEELEKRPDFSIRLISSKPYSNHNSLFFECKRISPTRSVADYINEGLMKFCDQRYAWAMSHAGMLAYVQDVTPTPQANIELEKHWFNNPTSFTVAICDPVVEKNGSIEVTITKHQRLHSLPSGIASGDITVRHLWLST